MATTEVVQTGEEAIELKIETDPKGHVHASARLTWCLPESSRKKLEYRQMRDLHLLVVVECGGKEMSRYCVPLGDPFIYVNFHRPGRNVVHATIVGRTPGAKSVKQVMKEDGPLLQQDWTRADQLGEQRSRLETQLKQMKFDGADRSEAYAILVAKIDQINAEREALFDGSEPSYMVTAGAFNVDTSELTGKYVVDVQKEFFGESWKITKIIGGIYTWEKPPRDQCNLRQRVSFTLATSPVALIFTAAISFVSLLVALWMLFWGYRTVVWRSVIHPYRDDFIDAWKYRGKSRWRYAQIDSAFGGKIDVKRPLWQTCLTPYGLVPVALISALSVRFLGSEKTATLSVGAVVAILLLAGCFFAGGWLASRLAKRAPKVDVAEARREEEERKQKAAQEQREQYQRYVASLSCDQRPSLDEPIHRVLRQQPSVRLAFKAAKGMVCKPFAR